MTESYRKLADAILLAAENYRLSRVSSADAGKLLNMPPEVARVVVTLLFSCVTYVTLPPMPRGWSVHRVSPRVPEITLQQPNGTPWELTQAYVRARLADATIPEEPTRPRDMRPLLLRALEAIETQSIVHLDYTNWMGERGVRRVRPTGLSFEATLQHPVKQWLLHGLCLDRGETRSFALANVHAWAPDVATSQGAL